MTKNDYIIEAIKENAECPYAAELIEHIEYLLKGQYDDVYDAVMSDETDDMVYELADSYVDIYTKDILDWYAEHADEAEEMIKEFDLTLEDGDVIKLLQSAQYWVLVDEITACLAEIRNFVKERA